MPRKTLPTARRAAIWHAHEHRCVYCTELISFADLDVDHIVPSHLKDKPEELAQWLKEYGLSNDFEVDGLLNLVPSHRHCNFQKKGRTLIKSRALHFLTIAEDKYDKAHKIELDLKEQALRDKVTISLEIALDAGRISSDELNLLLSSYATSQSKFEVLTTLPFVNAELNGFLSSADVDSLYDRPILPRHHRLDGLTMVKHSLYGEESINVFTCREWVEAARDSYYARTQYDIKGETCFKRVYALIVALSRAKTAEFKYISDPKASISNFDLLPVTLLPALSRENVEELDHFTSEGVGIPYLIAQGRVKIVSSSPLSLTLHYGHMGLFLSEILRADLNDDGVEDILVGIYEWALQGSFGYGTVIALTRLGIDQPFTLSENIELDIRKA